MYIKTIVEVSYDVPSEYHDAMMFAKSHPDWIRAMDDTRSVTYRKSAFERIQLGECS